MTYQKLRSTLTFLILFLLLAFATIKPTLADDSQWFAAAKLSLGLVNITDISHGGTIGTGLPTGNFIDGQIQDRETDDYTAGIGGSVGKRWGNWTLEAEYIYRYRSDWDIAAPTPSIATVTNVFNDVETHTLLINLLRRGVINQHWSWEVGAGVGAINHRIESSLIERATATVPENRFSDDEAQLDFTYNLLVGVTRELKGPWTLNLRYRYIDFGDLEAGPYPLRTAQVSAQSDAHEIQFALERAF